MSRNSLKVVARIFSFSLGCTFLLRKKWTTFFSRHPSKHNLKLLNNHSHRTDLPNFLKKLDSCSDSGGAARSASGVHLQLSPGNLANIFSTSHVSVHPLATLCRVREIQTISWVTFDERCAKVTCQIPWKLSKYNQKNRQQSYCLLTLDVKISILTLWRKY